MCPPSQDWALLAAGMVVGEPAQALLTHVADCESCGVTLRLASEVAAVEDTAYPAIAVETGPPLRLAARLAGVSVPMALPSTVAAPAGALAPGTLAPGTLASGTLASGTLAPAMPTQREAAKVVTMPRRRVWSIAAALAAGLALTIGGLNWQTVAPSETPADQLLAQAYSERRPFDFRLPGAEFAPVRVVRSSTEARLKRLVRAEVRIGAQLAQNPRDKAALQLRARAEMLEFDPAAAVITLQRVLTEHPNDASLLADLGSAHAQQSNWDQAHFALTAALALEPAHAVALYNRALVNERRGARAEAVADWDRYLALDGSSGWAKEAREHRHALDAPHSN